MLTDEEISRRARSVPLEERPVPRRSLAGIGSFLGIYGGEHIAATEFVIGALLVTWGVKAGELLIGLVVGNLLAASSYALVTAPIATDTRLTLFAYLRVVMGPWFQRAYNLVWGLVSVVWASSMLAISASSLKEVASLPVQLAWYPTSGATVLLTLVLAFVTVAVAAYGFRGVVKFSSLCVPWMVTIFFCGAVVSLPVLMNAAGMTSLGGPSGFLNLLESCVFTGAVPEGGRHLTWLHVAAFAWMCGFVYHVGLNDMSIFRYAKRTCYGWVGLYGMFLGHFFAWICAGAMGAAAALLLKTGLNQLDSGAVTGAVLGGAGLAAVIVAGWTTATPNIYRAALSFATFFPKWTLRRLSFFAGALIAVAACFPGVMRIDMIANAAALLVPPVGAICLVEHWLFPKLGLVRHWTLYRGRAVNGAGLVAWGLAALFALGGVLGQWMHPFFLPIPVFCVAAVSYPILAACWGARRLVPDEMRRDVDTVEARVAELAEEESPPQAEQDVLPSRQRLAGRLFRLCAYAALVTLVIVAVLCARGALTSAVFRHFAVVCTLVYFPTAYFADRLARAEVVIS